MKLNQMCLHGLTAIAALALLAAGAGPSAAKTYKYGSFSPPKANTPNLAIKPFFKEVKEKTNGKIQFRLFAGGSLVGPRNTLPGIRDRIVEAGFVVPAFVVSSLPHVNLIPDLLSFAEGGNQVAGAVVETMLLGCPECIEDYAKMNAIHLGGMGSMPYWLQCAKPVKKFSDLKGYKVRVAGAASGRWVKFMGGVAVGGMPPPDIVTGLQRGQVDCAIAIMSWLKGFSLADGVKQVITMPQGAYHGVASYVFNLDFWNGLTRKEKGIFIEAISKSLASATIDNTYNLPEKVVGPLMKKKKITRWPGDAAMKSAWKDFQKGEKAAVIAGAVKRGIKKETAERIVNVHLANLKKWGKMSKEIGTDKKKLAQALWDHVFSKVKY
ncbi:MAG: hypothetical protein CMM10_09630 [Rhodospirillaceae bacterium]|jgi:TRAP-type C4-dicarboxylate transport system substrate-binding protein|nr:hypothetical protein [Rhodospirillaceae bacterium]MDP6644284.1 C4-dicarboxylate TRAP transporter substrate-binding protein [Rhodospirillales bacterium]